MKEQSRLRGIALSLALMLGITGCAHAVNTGLGLLGVDRDQAENPFGSWSRSDRGGQISSGYQHAPTLDFWTGFGSRSQPYSISQSLFQGLNQTSYGSCLAVPLGINQVLPIANGTPSRALQRVGPIEIGLAGNLAGVGSILGMNGMSFARQALETSVALGSQGTNCGYSLFLFLTPTGAGNDPVSVLR
ncbi:MAG TPA: hypothetical protein EYO83_10810 [Gemmatimonadetes bacterium]|nr:hypothetical protein [Gemmatimonadota bacterium]